MKIRYLTTAMLALGLVTGCINIKVGGDSQPKLHDGRESGDRDKDKEAHEGKVKKGHPDAEKEDEDEKDGNASKASLQAAAKVTEATARHIAMETVPNGIIKEGELEKENGKLQWSFDIAVPGSKDITEVNIDAITGKILAVEKESPAAQAKEADEDSKKEKKEDKD